MLYKMCLTALWYSKMALYFEIWFVHKPQLQSFACSKQSNHVELSYFVWNCHILSIKGLTYWEWQSSFPLFCIVRWSDEPIWIENLLFSITTSIGNVHNFFNFDVNCEYFWKLVDSRLLPHQLQVATSLASFSKIFDFIILPKVVHISNVGVLFVQFAAMNAVQGGTTHDLSCSLKMFSILFWTAVWINLPISLSELSPLGKCTSVKGLNC